MNFPFSDLRRPDYLKIGVLSVISACICLVLIYWPRKRVRLPPGPPREFLLGHYRVVPVDAAFKQYEKWGKEYSKLK